MAKMMKGMIKMNFKIETPYQYWIEGEYKWMPIGIKMPFGWKKIELEEGLTLVQGATKGISSGMIKEHGHSYYAMLKNNKGDMEFMMNESASGWSIGADSVEKQGGDRNLAAGMYAQLWQYLPNG